ncbi:MAG TPA: alkaline phosphatase family protein, partial [Bryobacteraceae bacterium]|nr:alkaline phosphatase family protein [Bryobacteraceae bacterium]
LATKFFLRVKQPDLILVHFVDLDAEAHDNGPFTREANAKVEYTDELIGDILGVMPPDYALALVSDHGFERTDTAVNLARVLTDHARDVGISTYLLVARSQAAVSAIQKLRTDAAYGIGPSVPIENLKKLAPESAENALAAWEPAPHFTFAAGLPGESTESEIFRKINRRGNHGYWPLRQDYRSVYLLWHKGIKAQRLPEIPMTSIAERFAAILELPYPFTHTAAPVR